MSLVVMADGQKFQMEQPNERKGLLRNRERQILELTFRSASREALAKIENLFADPEKTEQITVYYHEDDPSATDERLRGEGENGPANKVFVGFTIPGDFVKGEVVKTEETPTAPAEYTNQLKVELGQRLFGE